MVNYSVEPMEYKSGYCATKCKTLEQAVSVFDVLTELADDVVWVIVPMNKQADDKLMEFYRS